MTTPTPADFDALYRDLGLDPSCGLEAFRQACRRRIGARHPDRAGHATDAVDAGAAMPVDQLIALYVAGVRFHRRHGRLPGAGATPGRLAPATRTRHDDAASAQRAQRSGRRHTVAASAVAVAVAALALLGALAMHDGSGPDAGAGREREAARSTWQPTSNAPGARDRAPTRHAALTLGMHAADVRAVQGAPIRAVDGLWEYGPSWLRFEDDRLVDWHSSPLRPLDVATASPPRRR